MKHFLILTTALLSLSMTQLAFAKANPAPLNEEHLSNTLSEANNSDTAKDQSNDEKLEVFANREPPINQTWGQEGQDNNSMNEAELDSEEYHE